MPQFARPDNDDSLGSWTDQDTTTTDIWDSINEVSASDADFVQSESRSSVGAYTTYQARLTTLTDPSSSSDHTIRYRFRKGETGGGAPAEVDLIVRLTQGGSTIASSTELDITTSFADGSLGLTSGQADSITDYTDLELQFLGNFNSGARTSWIEVSWAEFEVPSAGGTSHIGLHAIDATATTIPGGGLHRIEAGVP